MTASYLTVDQMKTEVRAALGNRTDMDSRLDAVLDLAQMRIARRHEFEELRILDSSIVTTPTGSISNDKTWALPTGLRIRKLYSVRARDAAGIILTEKLEKVLTSRWDQVIPEPEFYDRGVPTHYALWGKAQIELWRIPDIAYTLDLRLSKWPTSVVVLGGSAKLDLENVDDVVISLTNSYTLHTFGREEAAKQWFVVYRDQLKAAVDVDEQDFDLAMAGIKKGAIAGTRGTDDPFVRSITPGIP